MDTEPGNAYAPAPLLTDPTMASASGAVPSTMPNIPASELMAAAVSSTYLLSSMSQGMPIPNMPVMNLQPARMNPGPMQAPAPSGRSLSDFMLAQNSLLHPLVSQVPQLLQHNQFALMQDQQECVCINQAPNQAMVTASVRQQHSSTPMAAGNSSSSSGSATNRVRKRTREEGSSNSIKRQRAHGTFNEPTRNHSVARALQQQINELSAMRTDTFGLTASRSISNPNLPQQPIPQPPTVPVCANCRRVPVPNDEAGGSQQPHHHAPQQPPCNYQVFHTCNNGCPLINQAQFFRPNPQPITQQPPPLPTTPMMMYERPGSSANRVREGEQPVFPCVTGMVDSTMLGFLNSQFNNIASAQQRLQRMVPQPPALPMPPYFNRNYTNNARNTNFSLGLAAAALNPEQVNLLNTRQQQNAERQEQMNNFYRQQNPQRLVQVQTQTTSDMSILRNQTLQNNPMIIVPGFNPSHNGIEMISFLMNGHEGALYVPHAEATAHVAHAMNHEPQPIGASSECIKQCTTIKSYIKDPEVPELETERCTVCLLDFETGDEIRSLHCNHIYHIDCIDRWLQYNKKCPVCRVDMDKAPIVIDDSEDEEAANAIRIAA